ncbi:MAG: exodeoxyribonuclease V subunit beta [Candidatus Sericytochromatia bacterium]|nr:exodeoxyribonuclease V subunit beta [Candidatus Sericytochromatia bacterium]
MTDRPLPPLLRLPLSGRVILEASAGTGKTYTLIRLALRQIIEAGRTIGQLLLVTFTKAATQELTDRLRRGLQEALAGLEQRETQDPLLARWQKLPEARERLEQALRDLDQARIATIHSFCQQSLQHYAFLSRQPLQQELLGDQSDLLAQACADFWRRRLYPADQQQPTRQQVLEARWALAEDWTPASLSQKLQNHLGPTPLRVEPAAEPDSDLVAAWTAFEALFAEVQSRWQTEGEACLALLHQGRESGALSKGSFSADILARAYEGLQHYFSGDASVWPDPKFNKFAGNRFRSSEISAKKGKQAPQHRLFQALEDLVAASENYESRLNNLQRNWQEALLQEVPKAVDDIKQRRQQLYLNDLLTRLHKALEDPQHGPALAKALREDMPVAFIDEFQDTDGLQYAIFDRIYPQDADSQQALYLIGDPKQAIYRFRDADLNVYLQARAGASHIENLLQNYRSSPAMLGALNQFFTGTAKPFGDSGIDFSSVSSGKGADYNWQDLRPNQTPGAAAPLQFWSLSGASAGQKINVNPAAQAMTRRLVAEIQALLDAGAAKQILLPEQPAPRPLAAQDIAVLVRKKAQGEMLYAALSQADIPAVLSVDASVFASREAREMLWLLEAVLQPARRNLLMRALAIESLGWSAAELHSWHTDDAAWEEIQEAFEGYHQQWQRQNFAAMWSQLSAKEELYARMLRHSDGERRITNFRQLAELLQNQAQQASLGPAALVAWLEAQLHRPLDKRQDQTQDRRQLQLETDRQAVQIMTMHKSKGLEFAVVFCPFLWKPERKPDDKPLLYRATDGQRILDWGSPEHAERLAAEKQAGHEESLRLLYVALTRARFRLYLFAAESKDLNQSPLAHFLPELADKVPLAELLAQRAASSGGHWHHEALINTRKRLHAAARQRGNLDRELPEAYSPAPAPGKALRWRIGSFSALIHHSESIPPSLMHEQQEPETEPASAAASPGQCLAQPWQAFPAGKDSGIFLHKLLELADFDTLAASPQKLHNLVLRQAGLFQIPTEWVPILLQWLQAVACTRLSAGPEAPFALRQLARPQRIDEMAFCFPVRRLEPADLLQVLSRHPRWAGGLPPLGFKPLAGFLKGYIDLICCHEDRYYVMDYKSNRLGDSARDYAPEALEQVMRDHHYVLQYHLYLLALHRYLQQRLPDYYYERHIGGVAYLFLRGMDPLTPGQGVFVDRPPLAVIAALDRLMGDTVS